MLLFAQFALCKRPFVIVPSMFGSVLYGNIHNLKTHWYCKSSLTNEWLWATERYILPPVINCLAEYITIAVNETTGKPESRPEAEIYTIDFGGDQAIRYLDPGLFDHHLIPILSDTLDRFVSGGYEIRVDMFGAPYDWRLNPVNLDQYWIDLKGLIETAYSQNDNTPVALFGYSAGNYAMQQFLTLKVDKDWKAKYVNRAIMCAASFAGSFEAVTSTWLGKLPFMPAPYRTKDIDQMALSMPTLYAHLPNTYIFGDRNIIVGPDGEGYKAKDLYDLYTSHGKIPEEYIPIYKGALPMLNNDISDIEVDTYFIFNTGLDTIEGISFPDGWDKNYKESYGKGDTTINSIGLYYGCDTWKSEHVRVCHDLNTTDKGYDHIGMVHKKDVVELIFEAATTDEWNSPKVAKKTHYVTGHDSSVWAKLKKE